MFKSKMVIIFWLTLMVSAVGISMCSKYAGAEDTTPKVVCGGFNSLTEHLAKKYGEYIFWVGQESKDPTVVIFTNPESGSWTAAHVNFAEDRACIAQTGQDFLTITPKVKGTKL